MARKRKAVEATHSKDDVELAYYQLGTPLKKGDPMAKLPTAMSSDDVTVAKAQILAIAAEDQVAWAQLSSPEGPISSPATQQNQSATENLTSVARNLAEGDAGVADDATELNEASEASIMAPADSEEDLASMEDDSLASGSNLAAPDNSIRQQFQECVKEEVTNGKPLDKYEKEGIKLLAILKRKKTSLDTHDEIMEWHPQSTGKLAPGQKLGDHSLYLGREKLMDRLKKKAQHG